MSEENPFNHTILRLAPIEDKKEIFLNWHSTPYMERKPMHISAFAKELGLERKILDDWVSELKITQNYSSKDYFLSRRQEIDKAAADSCIKRPNSQLFTAIKKVSGELVEKDINLEVNINADYIEKKQKEGRERARRTMDGIRGLQGESALLSGEVCEN